MGVSHTVVGSLDEILVKDADAALCDLDYTLTDFGEGHALGIRRLAKMHGDDFAEKMAATFQLVLDGSRNAQNRIWDRRAEYRRLMGRILDRQGCSAVDGRPWSRETWIQLISDSLHLDFSQGQVEVARDTYWKAVGEASPMYPDAKEFVARLQELDIPLVLMTASDSPLQATPDGFRYDPAFAREYKERRLALLAFKPFKTIIGDPYDKPDRRFFSQVDAVFDGLGLYHRSRILAIGDSPLGDLDEPAKRGYDTYHIKRG